MTQAAMMRRCAIQTEPCHGGVQTGQARQTVPLQPCTCACLHAEAYSRPRAEPKEQVPHLDDEALQGADDEAEGGPLCRVVRPAGLHELAHACWHAVRQRGAVAVEHLEEHLRVRVRLSASSANGRASTSVNSSVHSGQASITLCMPGSMLSRKGSQVLTRELLPAEVQPCNGPDA